MSQVRKWWRGFDPAFGVAVAGTVAFYAIILQPAMHGTVLHRYTTEHPVDYILVALFLWGLADIVFKLASFPREMLALKQDWIPARQGREPITRAAELLEDIRQKPQWALNSRVGRRLTSALEFVTEKGSADEYREHLKYLADQDDDQVYTSYTLVRFVVGISPILGFLGTVVHFGTALGGLGFEQIAERLPSVVGEMGQAFNTTTVALATALSMMFFLFICERLDNGLVRSVDRISDRELMNRFEVKEASLVPFLAGVESANAEALGVLNGTLQRQIDALSGALTTVYQHFDDRQQQEREAWQGALDVLQSRHEQYDAQREDRLRSLMSMIEAKQDKHLLHIHQTLEKAVALRDDFHDLVKTLHGVAKGEGRLIELQSVLADNLRVIQETHQIEDALHGLTGAIHLLTARHRPGAFLSDNAAA